MGPGGGVPDRPRVEDVPGGQQPSKVWYSRTAGCVPAAARAGLAPAARLSLGTFCKAEVSHTDPRTIRFTRESREESLQRVD